MFEKSESGRIKKLLPLREMAISFGLIEEKRFKMLKKMTIIEEIFIPCENNIDFTMVDGYPVRDKIEFIIAFINEFGKRFGLTDSQAYRYLNTYGAIKNIDKHYGALHTQDFRGNVEDVATYCRRMGGQLL